MKKQRFVLIVDDDVTLQVLTKRQLKALGFIAEVANNGKEALEAVGKKEYELILMDVQMPEMDGLEATSHIRQWQLEQRQKRVPIIALTASRERDAALIAGMDDFLFKPVLLDSLKKVLNKWCGEKE